MRDFSLLMCLLAILLTLAGCGPSIRIEPKPIDQQLHEAVADRVKAEHKADEAIKTSADARAASLRAAADARAARAYADEKDKEVERLQVLARKLQEQEIAARITLASWWLAGVGLIVAAVGTFLFLRFQSKTAGVAALCGAGCVILGAVGLWTAPHWILVAWIGAAALAVGGVGFLLWLLLHREKSAVVLAGELKRYANLLPEKVREVADVASVQRQPRVIAKNISGWLDRAIVPDPSQETGTYEALSPVEVVRESGNGG